MVAQRTVDLKHTLFIYRQWDQYGDDRNRNEMGNYRKKLRVDSDDGLNVMYEDSSDCYNFCIAFIINI